MLRFKKTPLKLFKKSIASFNYILIGLAVLVLIAVLLKKTHYTNIKKQEFQKRQDHVDKALAENLSRSEAVELNNLILKGISMLSDEERKALSDLQKRFVYSSYQKLDEEEIQNIRSLNYKGIQRLSSADQERFKYLMRKSKNFLNEAAAPD
ncbi:MAG: hypothetical protein PHU64_03385 [Candidatus Omnitrophica bacterium]|nr:hypothetical protein [Candidatus Omnitrophota bacterium]MDD5430116.1 hypothetical protein [Candidatus Omnitrophota bacterium]